MSFRFSLRSVLVMVALSALGTAALVQASQYWLCAIGSLSVALLLTGVTLAINTKGGQRAFWIGFLTWGLLYLAAVWFVWQWEAGHAPGALATTEMLRLVYNAITREVPVSMPAGWPTQTMWIPEWDTFKATGHLLWAWVLAWIGGVVGRAMYVRFHAQTLPPPGGNSLQH
jgi:hypothetical protein